MKLYKTAEGIIIEFDRICYQLSTRDWDAYINRDDLYEQMKQYIAGGKPAGDLEWLETRTIVAPIENQEIWVTGVTYLRSKVARMEEFGRSRYYPYIYPKNENLWTNARWTAAPSSRALPPPGRFRRWVARPAAFSTPSNPTASA